MWEILTGQGRRARKASVPGESLDESETVAPLAQRKVKSQAQLRSLGTTSIAFKDLEISATIDEHDEGTPLPQDAQSSVESSEDSLSMSSVNASDQEASPRTHRLKKPQKWKVVKHVLIMVGLPGRGKTFLCNKLKCYLNWLGHNTKHINVGQFRRKQKDEKEVQAADFFDNNNQEGIEARNRALEAALQEVHDYLATETGQVVIFDATNTTGRSPSPFYSVDPLPAPAHLLFSRP